jgi:hypothetical protein
MNSHLPDDFLQPMIEALAPTNFGRPKTQAVFDRFLDRFETMLQLGYTYKAIAAALNNGGARGRRNTLFTEQSLYNLIARAREHAHEVGPTGTSNVAGEPKWYNLKPPTTSSGQHSTNASPSPGLGEFKRLIDEARSQAATDEFLFRGRNKRS